MAIEQCFPHKPLCDRQSPEVAERAAQKMLETLAFSSPEWAQKVKTKSIRVLDIGAGEGDLGAAFKRMGFDVINLDINRFEQNPQVPRLVGDAQMLPFKNDSIDLVVSYGPFDTLCYRGNDGEAMFREIHRVLRKGGLLEAIFSSLAFKDNDKVRGERQIAELFEMRDVFGRACSLDRAIHFLKK